LITQDAESGEYLVSEESADVLGSLPAPLAVVAIAGLWRTGKSYLLNHLSGAATRSGGFDVGATVNACTKGLWLWGEPVTLEDGLTVLFVDTEGLGSTSRTQTEDSQIFSLALLLSSLFVWNSRGVIDGNALEDFALVVNLTKHIHVRSNAGAKATADRRDDDDDDVKKKMTKKSASSSSSQAHAAKPVTGVSHELEALADHFPAFTWVVRDFTLRLEDRGRKINDRQYLENALKPQNSFSSEAASRNQIRTLLGTFFKERDCVTLVRPAEDEDTLRNLKNVPFTDLRPEFQKGMTTLKNKVYASLRPKAVNGRALTGSMLLTLARTYVDALNSGGVPTISTAWDRVLKNQANEAVDKALEVYDTYLATKIFGGGESEGSGASNSDRASLARRLLGETKRSLHLVAAAALRQTEEEEDDRFPGGGRRRRRRGHQNDDEDAVAAEAVARAAPGLPVEEAAMTAAHDEASSRADDVFTRAVWANAEDADPAESGGAPVLMAALKERKTRLAAMNDVASSKSCRELLKELLADPDVFYRPPFKKKGRISYADGVKAKVAELFLKAAAKEEDDDQGTRDAADQKCRALYSRDLEEAQAWLSEFDTRCAALTEAYAARGVGPAKWDVFADEASPALLETALEWANEVGVRHRAVSKVVRSHAAQLEEEFQTVNGELVASDSAVERELENLERAGSDSKVAADAAVSALEKRLTSAKAELARHKVAADRLSGAFDFATGLFEGHTVLQRELFDDMRRVLNVVRDAAGTTNGALRSLGGPDDDDPDDPDDPDADDDEEDEDDQEKPPKAATKKKSMMRSFLGGGGRTTKKEPPTSKTKVTKQKKKTKKEETWNAADLGFEHEEMAEFAPLSMAELKERIAEDEKELELMHEHAALTIEHAKVKKMLLADKDHELQEYEYQWGVAKANVAASEGELMVVDEEVAVLKGTVVQMHRYLEHTSRSGKLPSDLTKALTREQRNLLDDLLTSQPA